jgi:hypothetical protein
MIEAIAALLLFYVVFLFMLSISKWKDENTGL